ncbi:hypothetical protein LWP59_24850 [Amycolatopsis acidiphila]|uniref:Uncharacterized protein n=1 Tax=Amycolatopsis acidiphila TaxID=715473 RepID=A0A558ACE8_9PSEU|nr:hypothetical protein [Amycolatopsis acidiphila]TVT21949.1 hypothetical protein FNH06_15470 [Amycolatopsis acidiphila]UIJ57373.1 hypothetical protein LWP59_24850 [Amycolatopsis acidiphila]GHG84554.1 hypothetical protein GCM10017788_56690 [Amycolatopsis acidiphila]
MSLSKPADAAAHDPVPGRVVTGTVVRIDPLCREAAVAWRTVVLNRIGAALAGVALVIAALAGAPPGPLALVAGGALLVLLLLGALLRSTLPPGALPVGPTPLWPWALPLREAGRAREVDVLAFRVKDIAGAEHLCRVRGGLAAPARGANVEVYGRRDASGQLRVRQLVTPDSGHPVRPRFSLPSTIARTAANGATLVWFVTAVILFSLPVVTHWS